MKKQVKLMAGILGLMGVLASCGTAPSDNLGEMPTVAGKLSDYTQGVKVLKVSAGAATATGALNADGSFSVVLPTPSATDLSGSFKDIKCKTGKFTNSALDAKTGFASNAVFDDATKTTSSGVLVRATSAPTNAQPPVVGTKAKFAVHVYADKEATITYENCDISGSQDSTNIYNGSLTLKAGWNVIYLEAEVLEVSTTSPVFPTKTKATIGLGASGLDWRLVASTGTGPFKAPFPVR